MKIKVIPTIIAAAICALIVYGLFGLSKTHGQELLFAIGGFVCLFPTLGTCLGVRFERERTSANIAVIGGVFFVIQLVCFLVFTFVSFSTPTFVVVNGIILLLFLLVAYSVAKAKQ